MAIRKKNNKLKDHHYSMFKTHPVAMIMPLIVAFIWMGLLIMNNKSIYNIKYSPNMVDMQINSLFSFIVIYSLFLLVMFWHTHKLVLKHPRKS